MGQILRKRGRIAAILLVLRHALHSSSGLFTPGPAGLLPPTDKFRKELCLEQQRSPLFGEAPDRGTHVGRDRWEAYANARPGG